MKTCKVYGCKLHSYLMSALDRVSGQHHISIVFSWIKSSQYSVRRGLIGPQSRKMLEAVEKRRFISPSWESHPLFLGCPARGLARMPTDLSWLPIYCNVDSQSHARPDRDMPVAAQPLGCDVTQQEGEMRSVTGCYATLDKQVSRRARQ
jgi:hypothetical protein